MITFKFDDDKSKRIHAPVTHPFFPYFGGKLKLTLKYQRPTEETIIEPFAGSAGYSSNYPWRNIVLVDRSEDIVGIWKWLISQPIEEIKSIPKLKRGMLLSELDVSH